jgi:ELWxxDGT repeat protein
MKTIFTVFILTLCFQFTARTQCDYLTSFTTDNEGGVSVTVKSGNKLFFTAADSIHGRELWVTDGTRAGTHLVKDIIPGPAGSLSINFNYYAGDFNGVLFFQVNTSGSERGLWRSDGTKSGTWLVQDLYIDTYNYSLTDFAAADSILYFTANGTTLWRTNGTASGTYTLAYFQIVRNLATFKNNLYFSAGNNNTGEELWKTTGKTGKTILLKDLNGALGASLPCNFYATANALYFTAATNAGWELWKTTGSESSTQMVKDINPGGDGVLSSYSEKVITNIGNTIYFSATDGVTGYQLWKSDGTDAGTVRVSNIADGVSPYCSFPVIKGKVFFNSYQGPNYWQYDPATNTVSSTGYPFLSYFDNNYNRNASFIGSHLYYAGEDTVYGAEMWLSDGSAATTHKLQETNLYDNFGVINTIAFNSIFGTLGSKLLFTQARRPYDTQIPLFVYDTLLNTVTAFAPSVLVPVPLAGNKMHLVWNRIPDASQYEVRYREHSASTWTTNTVPLSYGQFLLNAATDYDFQVRAFCNNVWTSWSDKLAYNTSFVHHDNVINILADRAEDATTTRIYWLKTPEIIKIRVRYRKVGTTAWTGINNASGFTRLTGLAPSTFYEYQYQSYVSGYWGGWYPSSLHFVTPAATVNPLTAQSETGKSELLLSITPNPATGVVHIKNELPPGTYFAVTDAAGNILRTGKLNNAAVDLTGLHTGVLTIIIQKGDFKRSGKVLKQ